MNEGTVLHTHTLRNAKLAYIYCHKVEGECEAAEVLRCGQPKHSDR
jgi:hypothetical protein